MMRIKEINTELEFAILKFIDNSEEPVGAVNLAIILGEEYDIAQASLGRRLLRYDHLGLTKKVKNQGRVLTEKGKVKLEELKSSMVFEKAKQEFLDSIDASSLHDLIDILVARRGLEKEAANLAASYADAEIIEKMQKVLAAQKAKLDSGDGAVDAEDAEFHRLIALASQNTVLVKAISLLREQNNLTQHFATVRKMIGGKLYEDHLKIFQSIAARDAEGAVLAVEGHLNSMIKEFERYITNGRSTKE